MNQMGIRDWKVKSRELKREAYALYLCSRHPRTPLYAKLFALLIIGYAMSPIDLIPDFIPVIGYLDDLVLIPLGITILIKMMPEDVLQECRLKAQSLQSDKPVWWIGVILVMCIWAATIYLTYRLLSRMF